MSERQHCPACIGRTEMNRPCPGFPASSLRILPPRPPNVAALLDEEASLPESKVEAVMRSASTMRTILRPIFDYVPLSDKRRGEVWSAMKEYDDALADLDRKEP